MQFSSFATIATNQKIDSDKAVISGVSVIVTGEAQGHGLTIDSKTLQQVKDTASKFSSGLKVRYNHPSKGKDASVLSTAGVLKNFRIEGDCVRADLHLLKTEADTPKILEMASVMPEAFGLSVVFSGKDEEKDGQKFARCTEIYACDLVDDPAANPTGLFSTNNEKDSMFDKFKTQLSKLLGVDADKATETEIEAALTALGAKECAKCGGKHKAGEMCMSKKKDDNEGDDDKKMAKLVQDAVAPLVTQLAAIQGDRNEQISLAKKSEIDALIAEASKEGKIIPLETGDIYEQKDGKTTIKMEPSMLRKMLEKLPKAQIQTKRGFTVPKSSDGTKTFDKGSPEHRQFYSERKSAGADALTQKFQNIN